MAINSLTFIVGLPNLHGNPSIVGTIGRGASEKGSVE